MENEKEITVIEDGIWFKLIIILFVFTGGVVVGHLTAPKMYIAHYHAGSDSFVPSVSGMEIGSVDSKKKGK